MQKIGVIPGDGIGPEVIREARKALDIVSEMHGLEFEYEEFPLGTAHYLDTGEVLSEETLQRLSKKNAILLGAMGDPRVKPGLLEKGVLLRLRFHFDQYVNLRPVKLYEGVPSPLADSKRIDMTFVRENTEDFYVGIGARVKKGLSSNSFDLKRRAYEAKFDVGVELEDEDDLAYQMGVVSKTGARRVIEFAFQLAERKGLGLVTAVDKANVLTEAYGLWREMVEEVSAKHAVAKEFQYVDAVALHMVRNPERFKVLVTPNMFGDILTDLGAALQGGLGLAPSGNINPAGVSMFEPVHGSAPDIAGKGMANPIGAMLSVALMLETLGHEKAATDLEEAVKSVLRRGDTRTPDMGGKSTTAQMGEAVVSDLKRK
ncbi:MAG: isocitrate/isopropylmalate dehydrogenase family protein [Candidatus Thermoplasmatota archaeon]|nr:isocitrate/isopropylmalate dehydrogenase family protein [Candidatus Thermoplasmatota archaeon]